MPNGPRIRANNVYGVISDNPLTAASGTFNSASLPLLPVVSAAHAVIVFDPKRVFGDPEIVVVTAHTASSTVASILRGQYGTSPREHPQGTAWAHVPIDEDYTEIVTSSTRPSDPYRGQMIFESDTDKYVGRSTADTWVDVVPLGAWSSWTPAITQGVAVTATIAHAKFTRFGRTVHAHARLSVTSAGTVGQPVNITIPVLAPNAGAVTLSVGWGSIIDVTVASYVGQWFLSSSVAPQTIALVNDLSGSSGNVWGAAPSAGLASGDVITFSLTYEAAS